MMANSSSELVIRRLYQITNDYHKGFEYQVSELLQMGLERFGLDIGILSRIEKDEYIVEQCVVPETIPMQSGDRFEFGTTYCSITYGAEGPVALENVGMDDTLAVHPAYLAFGLESYIGVPIQLVNGERYGTLNFSSPTPYPREFREIDIDVLQLMASWVGVELVRRQQEVQLNTLNNELKLMAHHDSLTKVSNRRGMYSVLFKDLNQLSRQLGEGAVAMIDVDHFKRLNDTYGHQKGDEALIQIAKKISDSLRDYDFVARFSGEEFLVWLPNTNQEGSATVCNRIMQSIAKIDITSEPITVSIGACHFCFVENGKNNFSTIIDDLVAKADAALYEAKGQGRNRLVVDDKMLTYL